MFKQPFYFSTITNMSAIFGTIFNNLTITMPANKHRPAKDVLVPLAFAHKQNYIYWIDAQAKRDKTSIHQILPRMSYEITSIVPSSERKVNPLAYATNTIKTGLEIDDRAIYKQMSPVAYDIKYKLSIYSKNMETSLRIIEQILPYFAPEVCIKCTEIEQLGIVGDIKVLLESATFEDNYLEGFEKNRMIVWDLDFSLSGNMYPNFTGSNIIKTAIIDMNTMLNEKIATVTTRGFDPDMMNPDLSITEVEEYVGTDDE